MFFFTHRISIALDLFIFRLALHIKNGWYGSILQHCTLDILKTQSSEMYYTQI